MIACTKCGNAADPQDSVCLVCGGFLAGTREPATLTVGAGDEESDFFVVTDEARDLQAGEVGQVVDRSWWPVVSRGAMLIFYVAFVLAVALAVNWMLRRL